MDNLIIINEKICKGCGLCAVFCAVGELIKIDTERVNAKGWNPAVCTDQSKCISCALCALMCPDAAIEVTGQLGTKVNDHGI